MIAWLLACTAVELGGGERVLADGDSGGVSWTRPDLTQPPTAEDLDAAEDIVHVQLTASAHVHELEGPDGLRTIEGYAYDGSTPGPTIRASLGDTLIVDLDNDLGVPTTIHWHGVHVPWEMDGVTWMQDPIAAGDSFTYTFPLEQAGTFWYHPHFDTERQVDLGLYGVLIVEDPTDPEVDHDLVAVADDWLDYHEPDTGWVADPTDSDDAHGLHGDEGLWTVNGLHQPLAGLAAGSSVRLRLLNASSTGYLDLRHDDLRLVATDQGRLPAPLAPEAVILAPGDRVELEWALGDDVEGGVVELLDHPFAHQGGPGFGEAVPLLGREATGLGAAPGPLAWPQTEAEVGEDDGNTDIVYVFAGDTETGDWFINGEIFPDVTVESLALGAEVVVEVRNLSPTHHPFHLHGHAFEVLSVDGEAPDTRTVEDTVDVPMHAAVRLRLVADNPGDWMTHCHILPHAEGGMMTVLRVEDE